MTVAVTDTLYDEYVSLPGVSRMLAVKAWLLLGRVRKQDAPEDRAVLRSDCIYC